MTNSSLLDTEDWLNSLLSINSTSETLYCRLIVASLRHCFSTANSGLDCQYKIIDNSTLGHFQKPLEYFCLLNLDVQNETSYDCRICSSIEIHSISGLNASTCGFGFKLNMVSVVFETALKSMWLRLPEWPEQICRTVEAWDASIKCFANDIYGVTDTLEVYDETRYFNSSVLNSVYENFKCFWNIKSNETNDGLVGVQYDWIFLFVIVFIVAGGVGNILVCLAVCLDKRLQNVTNYFLLSLAIADLLVSLFVMPMGAIPGFLGYWPLGVVWCNVYVTCDVLACSASIMHMCFISIGRYLGIRNPLKSRHHSTKRVVAIKIALVWLLSMFVSSSITVLGLINQSNIMPTPELCVINNRLFWVLGSLVAFYVPMLTMVVSFALTVQLLKRQAKLAIAPIPGGEQRRLCGRFDNSPMRRYGTRSSPDLSPTRSTVSRNVTWRITSTNRMQRNKMALSISQPQLSYMNGCGAGVSSTGEGRRRARDASTQTPPSISAETRRARLKTLKLPLAAPNVLTTVSSRFLVGRKKGRSMSANAVANEQKATKVLGLVFFTFVLCWAPFFLLNILFASCPSCIVPEHVVDICLWLGYVSSTINPIIYTVFNKTFRAAFLRLLRCHCTRRGRCARYHSVGEGRGASQLCLQARTALPLSISLRPSPLATCATPSSPAAPDTSETILMEEPI